MNARQLVSAMALVVSLCSAMSGAGADTPAPVDTSATGGEAGSVTSAVPTSHAGEKSGRTAFLWSFLATGVLGGTAAIVGTATGDANHQAAVGTAAALGVTAYLAGPATGHFYAGQARRAWFGIGLRSVIGLGFTAALVTLVDEGGANDQENLSVALLAAGAGGVVLDIATAPRSARIRNEKSRRMSLGPASVGGAPGIRVGLDF